jgi:uncharacterized membrane protein YeaQ/YmgE (transglycosylase-associated protein family)
VRLRRQLSRGDIALIAVSGLVGAVAGGWLDYNIFSDNDDVRALAVRLLAIVVAVVAAAVWSRRHGRGARVVALAAAVFLVSSLIGGWIAPSAHPAGWSTGSARLEIHGALSRTETIGVECRSDLNGTSIGFSGGMATSGPGVATNSLNLAVSIQSEVPLSGGPVPTSAAISLDVGLGEPGNGQAYAYDPEQRVTAISADGTPEHGHLTFENLSARTKDGDPSLPNDLPTLAGVIDWTCQPAAKEPTPVEGSWFH